MIAVDCSTLVACLAGDRSRDTDWHDQTLALQQAVLLPVVLTEVLSAPGLDREAADLLRGLPVLDVRSGFWERAAETRARVLPKRLRARLADTLIARRASITACRWSRATTTSDTSRHMRDWICCSSARVGTAVPASSAFW